MSASIHYPFHPDPHSSGATAASAAYQGGQRAAQKADELSGGSLAVDRGRVNADTSRTFNDPHAATNSHCRDYSSRAASAGEGMPPPAPSPAAFHDAWTISRDQWWQTR